MSLCGNNNPCPDLITGQKCGITYTGARYVPLFADPAEWSSANAYEPLTIVIHEGNSYTSKTFVPVGVDIANEQYWALTGNYNAQVEAYRKEVEEIKKENLNKPYFYTTLSELQNSSIKAGYIVFTGGLNSINDGGHAVYYITNTEPDSYYESLNSGLYAELLIDNYLDLKCISKPLTVEIINEFISKVKTLVFPELTINLTGTININKPIEIDFNNCTINLNGNQVTSVINISSNDVSLKNLNLNFNYTGVSESAQYLINVGDVNNEYSNINIDNINFSCTNKPTLYCLAIRAINNSKISNINGTGTFYTFINAEWGINTSGTVTYHPHNIVFENISVNNTTPIVNETFGFRLSACYNIEINNLLINGFTYGVGVFAGDNGGKLAPPDIRNLIMKNINFSNISCTANQCIYITEQGTNLQPDERPTSLIKFNNLFLNGLINAFTLLQVHNIEFRNGVTSGYCSVNFGYNIRFENISYDKNINIGQSQVCEQIIFRDCHFNWSANSHGLTFTKVSDSLIYNCDFVYSGTANVYDVNLTTTSSNTTIKNCIMNKGLVNGTSTTFIGTILESNRISFINNNNYIVPIGACNLNIRTDYPSTPNIFPANTLFMVKTASNNALYFWDGTSMTTVAGQWTNV